MDIAFKKEYLGSSLALPPCITTYSAFRIEAISKTFFITFIFFLLLFPRSTLIFSFSVLEYGAWIENLVLNDASSSNISRSISSSSTFESSIPSSIKSTSFGCIGPPNLFIIREFIPIFITSSDNVMVYMTFPNSYI